MKLSTNRVEAFSDGVIAIIITIMVFKIQLPESLQTAHGISLMSLASLVPYFLAYMVSFVMLSIIWVNHHHFMHLVKRTDEKMLWLNLHLLFWLSLIPFPTSLLGAHPFDPLASFFYGAIMFMNITAILILRHYVEARHLMFGADEDDRVERLVKRLNTRAKAKAFAGMFLYALGATLAFVSVFISYACFILATMLFFIPDGVDDEQVAEQIVEENK